MLINFNNKIYLKRCLRYCAIAVLIFELVFFAVQWSVYKSYTQNYNQVVGHILQYVKENTSNIDTTDLVEILNRGEFKVDEITHILDEYGVDIKSESLILENDQIWKQSVIINVVILLIFAATMLLFFLIYNFKKDKELEEIVYYVEQINQRNYKLEIDTVTEDELSILKSEIYKTTVMLKEVAENAMDGKKSLKDALSDISHQIKTPLATMQIMLDNMEMYPEMETATRQYYIKKMKREIQNLNVLVQSLLKLSKLEADVVVFAKENVDMKSLVEAATKNVEILCDLKNISVNVTGISGTIECDYHWQVEAITNILKNCVEYSPENENVLIEMQDNPVFTSIIIRDFGQGMTEEEQKHIFERFYKGKDAVVGSVGIGLALAKAIVEANNGRITVESGDAGTVFEIRYFKHNTT